jgi:DNA-binding SARP family transcriptional activator
MSAPPRPLQAQLVLLGDFALTFPDEVVAVSKPAQRLLAYLAVVHGRSPAGRGTLAQRLWIDSTPARAASSLRSVLWRLPRLRGRPLVTCTATTVRLSDDVRVDLWEAEELTRVVCAEADPPVDVLSDLGLLAQDLLPEWHEDWLQVEQESFRQRRLHALERSARVLCGRGRFTDALTAGLGAVRSEPLRESAHRRVIEVHLAEGNHAEALRQYHSYRRLLVDELGLNPSPAMRGMVAALLGRPADVV